MGKVKILDIFKKPSNAVYTIKYARAVGTATLHQNEAATFGSGSAKLMKSNFSNRESHSPIRTYCIHHTFLCEPMGRREIFILPRYWLKLKGTLPISL
jgi:hypothetical protein